MSDSKNSARPPILKVDSDSLKVSVRISGSASEAFPVYYLDVWDNETSEEFRGLAFLETFPNPGNIVDLPDWKLHIVRVERDDDGSLWALAIYRHDTPIGNDGDATMTIRFKLSRLDEWGRICTECAS